MYVFISAIFVSLLCALGLFHRGISQSGSALCTWAFSPNSTTRYQTETLAKQFGCPTESSEEIVACLRSVDANELIEKTSTFLVSNEITYSVMYSPWPYY